MGVLIPRSKDICKHITYEKAPKRLYLHVLLTLLYDVPLGGILISLLLGGKVELKLDITKMSLLMPYGKVSTAAFEKTAISS